MLRVTWEIAFVFILLAMTFGAMVWEKISVDLIALLALCALMVTGILTPREAFQVFGNDAAITVACMFVLSAALEHTGVIELMGRRLNMLGGKSDWVLLVFMLPIVALLSAFVNNTPVVVVFMPIMIAMATKRGIKPSKLLIPLSYAAILGGCCTLIGTSTNILVSSTAEKLGQKPLAMFEIGKIGLITLAVGFVYLLTIGRKLLPDRETLASLLQSTASKEYLTEAVIVSGSPLVGKKLADTPLKSIPNARIVEITRLGETLKTPLNEVVLEEGDHLRLMTVLSSVMEIKGLKGIEILPHANLGLQPLGMQKASVVECVVGPDSELIGKTVKQVNFRQRYGVLILAVHRQGVNLRENFETVKLRFGDTLLLEGTQTAIHELQNNRNFLMLADVPHAQLRRDKMGIAIGTIAAVVVLASLGVMPIAVLSLIGALVVVITRCIEAEAAYKAIEWRIIFLIFGMLSMEQAMSKTGGADLIAAAFIHGMDWVPAEFRPYVTLSLIYLITAVLTEFLSNNAVAVLMTPIALSAAEAGGLDARPFMIAVAMAASASFSTPIGYQTNTLVYGAGGYQFRDFLKVGLPLNILCWIIATIFIPMFWPLK
ncbi:MAG: SLC13 family permease [Verrucomicrobiota bacterium]